MKYRWSQISCLLIISCLILTGCGRVSDNAEKLILQKDNSFETAYKAKKDVEFKASKLRAAFEIEEKRIMSSISTLKAEHRKAKNYLSAEIKILNQSLKPYVDVVASDIRALRTDHKDKMVSLRTAQKKIRGIDKLVGKKKDLTLSHDEIALWSKRKESLEKEKEEILKTLRSLKNEIALKKLELRVLKE